MDVSASYLCNKPLYGHLKLNDMNKEELSEFLREEVITRDFIWNKTLYGSGLQKDKPEGPSPIDMIEDTMRTFAVSTWNSALMFLLGAVIGGI